MHCVLVVQGDGDNRDSNNETFMSVFSHLPPNLLNPKGCYNITTTTYESNITQLCIYIYFFFLNQARMAFS